MITVQRAHIIVLVQSATKTLLKVFKMHQDLLMFMSTLKINIINIIIVFLCAYSVTFIIILSRDKIILKMHIDICQLLISMSDIKLYRCSFGVLFV